MTHKQLIKLGFELKLLASGNIVNVTHRNRFSINNIACTTCKSGFWIRSLDQKTIDKAAEYINEISFID